MLMPSGRLVIGKAVQLMSRLSHLFTIHSAVFIRMISYLVIITHLIVDIFERSV